MIPFPFLFLHRCCGGYMGNPSNNMMVYLFSYSVLWRLIFTLLLLESACCASYQHSLSHYG